MPGMSPIRRADLPSAHVADDALRFSFSSLETYQECPRKYMYQKILGLSKDESGTALALGNGVHHALQDLNGQWQETGNVPGPDAIEAALEVHWNPGEFEFRELSRQLRLRASAMIKRYYAWEAANGLGRRPIGIEQRISDTHDKHRLTGFIDLIVEDKQGNREIVDFKTGSPDQYKPAESLQLFLYCRALANSEPSRPVPTAAYVALKQKEDKGFKVGEAFVPGKQHRSTGFETGPGAPLGEVISGLLNGILANDFHPNPGDACTFCRFRWMCPAGSEAG